jgi:ParB family transcriptional regulator, chromosome partitioning protein
VSEKRRGLGRGLGSLIPTGPEPGTTRTGERPVDVFFGDRDEPTDGSGADGPAPVVDLNGLVAVPGAHFAEIPVGQISPNPKQPRQVFDEDEMAELVHSIKEIGVLQPVVVRPAPGAAPDGSGAQYELIMGERRWRASQLAGLDAVPAIVRETAEDDLLRDALLENLHRSQLNPLEEAAAYQQLLDDFGCTHDELASRIGRSRPQISNTLRLLRLPPLVQRRVAAGVLSAGHARALLALDDSAAMERLAQRIVAEGLSVRSVEEIVAVGEDRAPSARQPRPGTRMAVLDDLAARLSDRLDTRVKIALGRRKGRLTVEFATVDDLQRIVSQIAPGENGPFPGSQ